MNPDQHFTPHWRKIHLRNRLVIVEIISVLARGLQRIFWKNPLLY